MPNPYTGLLSDTRQTLNTAIELIDQLETDYANQLFQKKANEYWEEHVDLRPFNEGDHLYRHGLRYPEYEVVVINIDFDNDIVVIEDAIPFRSYDIPNGKKMFAEKLSKFPSGKETYSSLISEAADAIEFQYSPDDWEKRKQHRSEIAQLIKDNKLSHEDQIKHFANNL